MAKWKPIDTALSNVNILVSYIEPELNRRLQAVAVLETHGGVTAWVTGYTNFPDGSVEFSTLPIWPTHWRPLPKDPE